MSFHEIVSFTGLKSIVEYILFTAWGVFGILRDENYCTVCPFAKT